MSEQFASPMDFLFDEESLLLDIEAEDAVGGNIGAGLDWGSAIGQLMLNPGLFSRLTALSGKQVNYTPTEKSPLSAHCQTLIFWCLP